MSVINLTDEERQALSERTRKGKIYARKLKRPMTLGPAREMRK